MKPSVKIIGLLTAVVFLLQAQLQAASGHSPLLPPQGELSAHQGELSAHQGKRSVHEGKSVRNIVVSLENSRHVWKYQRGTSQADILYEIVAEGHITRILSLFKNVREVKGEIGPIRSVRNYFMPFITDIEAVLLFCGASPSGYGRLQKETSIIGCDEISNSDIFHRRKDIARPHNLFTDSEQVLSALRSRGITLSPFEESGMHETTDPDAGSTDARANSTGATPSKDEMWVSPDEAKNVSALGKLTPSQIENHNAVHSNSVEKTGEGRNISIRYSSSYCVSYTYNEETGLYYRCINGAPHVDNNCGSQLAPSTVVIARTQAAIMDTLGRLDIDIPAELPVTIFTQGKTLLGSWSQPGGNSPLPLCDEEDFPLIPPAGQIIFHLISPMVSVNANATAIMAKKESAEDTFKRLWNGLISGATSRPATLKALATIAQDLTIEERKRIDSFLIQQKDNLKVRAHLVSALLHKDEIVRKFSAVILTTFYKADGYEYVKGPVLQEKLLSEDQFVKSRALTELVDNLEGSGTLEFTSN